MAKDRTVQTNPLLKVTSGDGDQRCAYTSHQFGRCRYWGTISKPSGAPAICNGHYRSESGIEAEQVVEASLKWRPTYWKIKTGNLEYENWDKAANETSDHWERQAKLAAIKFGVDSDLSPRDRAMAIARKFQRSGGVGAGYRRERQPGEDDE